MCVCMSVVCMDMKQDAASSMSRRKGASLCQRHIAQIAGVCECAAVCSFGSLGALVAFI